MSGTSVAVIDRKETGVGFCLLNLHAHYTAMNKKIIARTWRVFTQSLSCWRIIVSNRHMETKTYWLASALQINVQWPICTIFLIFNCLFIGFYMCYWFLEWTSFMVPAMSERLNGMQKNICIQPVQIRSTISDSALCVCTCVCRYTRKISLGPLKREHCS